MKLGEFLGRALTAYIDHNAIIFIQTHRGYGYRLLQEFSINGIQALLMGRLDVKTLKVLKETGSGFIIIVEAPRKGAWWEPYIETADMIVTVCLGDDFESECEIIKPMTGS